MYKFSWVTDPSAGAHCWVHHSHAKPLTPKEWSDEKPLLWQLVTTISAVSFLSPLSPAKAEGRAQLLWFKFKETETSKWVTFPPFPAWSWPGAGPTARILYLCRADSLRLFIPQEDWMSNLHSVSEGTRLAWKLFTSPFIHREPPLQHFASRRLSPGIPADSVPVSPAVGCFM